MNNSRLRLQFVAIQDKLTFDLYLANMQFRLCQMAFAAILSAWMGSFSVVHAQYALDYGFAVGGSNYLGDIGGDEMTRRDFAADLHLSQTRFSSHAFARYRFNQAFAIKAQVGSVYLEDFDRISSNPARMTRNAHFRNFVNELSLRGEVNLFTRPLITKYTSRYRIGVNAYAMVGLTGFMHSPQAQLDRDAAEYLYGQEVISTNPALLDYGRWYDLREVGTEKNSYSKVSAGFPLGLGASFMVNYKIRIGVEFVWNLTLTDYLDDVSYTYADPNGLDDVGIILSQPSSLVVAELSGVDDPEAYLNNFRWDAAYESPRGNPDKNDSYGTLQLTVSKVVMSSSDFMRDNSFTSNGNKRGKGYNPRKRRKSNPGDNRYRGRGRAKF